MGLPADSHVHSQWSWDAFAGTMQGVCARAVDLGLPAIAFTEHVDHTVWTVDRDELDEGSFLATVAGPDGRLTPPPFDAAGYLESIEDCRERFPGLRILSGLEAGEPHWHAPAIGKILAAGPFDRVLGSLHCLPDNGGYAEPPDLFRHRAPAEVVRQYLAEVAALIAGSDVFTVLAHIDFPVRYWPAHAGPFDPYAFEEEFRHALRLLADSGRALEVNTCVPLHPEIVRWWREEGGSAITFGSDAHEPDELARGFATAVDMVQAHGFRPGRDPHDYWIAA
ncbi:MAG: PHP domain-containing protein [Hamadaea sp.]|nr:PHP domain-containing protein [Hamadaea sp.]NUT20782.1 PHP domain-containing protein [Hamadaea sp.]